MDTKPISRPFLAFNGVLMIIGGLLWMWGGSRHPTISEEMGEFGTDAFFWEFAELMVYDPQWQAHHEQMLIAPTMWAVGAFGVLLLIRRAGESRWTPLGFVMLTMGAVLWVLTYMYDGWVAPETGKALLASEGDPTLTAAITQTFASGQWFTIRISMYAWLLIAFGTAAMSVGLISLARSYPRGPSKVQAWILAGLGLFLGAWSFVAWATGAYDPGPMVSLWWMPAAIATQVWWLSLGILIVLHSLNVHELGRRRQQPTPLGDGPGTASVPAAESPADGSTGVDSGKPVAERASAL
ncbi:hypothetical protein O7632_22815 [Solwaraspora sp. WMMD406]|uniref:hypothetical protein n=1 Tax=Solwaraspora sp. WMMD406 TaxID=3016095 RepID=UPI00241665CE|nr:hypothetical protein [Solwaraspora sp. WMMD406]MDG4766909.1 hypothetical protein [Solwaraspora sp. WMMD406]